MSQIPKGMSYSLSNFDIYNMLDNRCKVMSYDDLAKCKTLKQALGHYDAFVLLYLTKENYGHWTCCFMYPDNKTCEFFDSYSYKPDDELSFVPKEIQKEYKENFPYLSKLLLESGCKIVYNNHKLQESKLQVNTCGRHVVSRLVYRDVPIDNYVNIIKKTGLTPDQFVLKITNSI
jgi:hypothetical protein